MMLKSVSFCTTCRNRLWQLRQTLSKNLNSLNDDHEIVLVDYGSTDGLREWVWDHFKSSIEAAKLVFFEVKNEIRWNVARAKNLAHRLATGQYLFNLDADNFLSPTDRQQVEVAAHRKMACWQYSGGSREDGSFGRIGLPTELFKTIGGYDETLLPMGCQDVDLLARLGDLRHPVLQLKPPSEPAIHNSMDQKVVETMSRDGRVLNSSHHYRTLDMLNHQISKIKLATEGPIRVGGGFSYRGLLNGKSITIDGFDEIRGEV